MSTTLIERLNAIIATGEVSRAGLARAAGLHPNSLRKLGTTDWNPTADTLLVSGDPVELGVLVSDDHGVSSIALRVMRVDIRLSAKSPVAPASFRPTPTVGILLPPPDREE